MLASAFLVTQRMEMYSPAGLIAVFPGEMVCLFDGQMLVYDFANKILFLPLVNP